MEPFRKPGLHEKPSVVIAGLLAAIIAIVAFLTGKPNLPEIISWLGDSGEETGREPTDEVYNTPSPSRQAGTGPVETGARQLNENVPSPSEVVQRYWAAVDEEDYRVAWDILSPRFRASNHSNEFAEYARARRSMQVCSVHTEGVRPLMLNTIAARVEGTVVFKAGRSCHESRERFAFSLIRGVDQDWLIDRVMPR